MEEIMKDNSHQSPPQWLTLADLANRWKVCKRTVTRIPCRQLPYFALSSQRRYKLQDVLHYEHHRKKA